MSDEKIDTTSRESAQNDANDVIWGSKRDISIDQLGRRVKTLETLWKKKDGIQLFQISAAPPPPKIVSSLTANGQFVFAFNPVNSSLVAGYNVYRSNQLTNSGIAEFVCSYPQASDLRSSIKFNGPVNSPVQLYYWVCSFNSAGVESVRIKVDINQTYVAPTVLCIVLIDTDPIDTDATLSPISDAPKLFVVSIGGDRILAVPTGAQCGQIIRWRIINTSANDIELTLADGFRWGVVDQVAKSAVGPGDMDVGETKVFIDQSTGDVYFVWCDGNNRYGINELGAANIWAGLSD